MPSLQCNRKLNTFAVARQLQVGHFDGYARRPGTVGLHGNQQWEGQCFHWAGWMLYKEGKREVSQFREDIRVVQFRQQVARDQFSARSEL
jgi:hypothetical protein